MKKRTAKNTLMGNSMKLMIIVFAVTIAAFACNILLIQKWYRDDAEESRQTLFNQTAEQVRSLETEIQNLAGLINNSSTILDYLDADVLGGRWTELTAYKQFVGNVMGLNNNIVGISLYDENNNLVAAQGTEFSFVQNDYVWGEAVWFSDTVQISGQSTSFFQVVIPIFEKIDTGSFYLRGHAVLLFHTKAIKEILDLVVSAYSEDGNYIAINDRNGNALISAGNEKIWDGYSKDEDNERKYLTFEEKLQYSGWSLLYVSRTESFMSAVSRIQMINMITYSVIVVLFAIMCLMMYRTVVKPIRRQMDFVVGFSKDTSQRLEVCDNNEFGILEQEINEMLDDLENLNKRIVEEENRNLKLEYAKKQTELQAYKSQINPHFMHNALECVRGMALYHGEKEIAKLTAAMSKMFQYNIKGDDIVTVHEVLTALQNYAVIVEYRFMGKIRIDFETENGTEEFRMPKMLVQPLLENAVQHGLEPKEEKGCASVKFKMDNKAGHKNSMSDTDTLEDGDYNILKIIIEDNGAGMSEETLKRQLDKLGNDTSADEMNNSSQEIGIFNVTQRLKLYYGNKFSFLMESKEQVGTRITLLLPDIFDRDIPGNERIQQGGDLFNVLGRN